MRLPTALLPGKKCSANLRLTIATVGSSLRVEAREVAALEERDAHRLEVAGRQRVHERLHVLAVLGLVPFDRHRAVPLVAGQDRHRGQRRPT